MLFIDEWTDGLKVYFLANGVGVYTHVYSLETIIGEQKCGRSFHDHHEFIEFTFEHTNLTEDVEIVISCPHEGYQWGIKDVVVGLLTCHSTCTECTGPN